MIRRAVVAGSFYPGSKLSLEKEISSCFLHKLGPGKEPKKEVKNKNILGGIVPHAGYMYSGPFAANVYYMLSERRLPDTIIIIGPNHTGLGSLASVMIEGAWETPLGAVEIDSQLGNELFNKIDILDSDTQAHTQEHSIEVQLPFLQSIYGEGFRFVPISLLMQDLDVAKEIGTGLSKVLKRSNKDVVILASSDFTHYEPYSVAKEKDTFAIKKILSMDYIGFFNEVKAKNLSICGYGPITTTLIALKELGVTKGHLLRYGSSGDITGDHSAVVGYAGIIFERDM